MVSRHYCEQWRLVLSFKNLIKICNHCVALLSFVWRAVIPSEKYKRGKAVWPYGFPCKEYHLHFFFSQYLSYVLKSIFVIHSFIPTRFQAQYFQTWQQAAEKFCYKIRQKSFIYRDKLFGDCEDGYMEMVIAKLYKSINKEGSEI